MSFSQCRPAVRLRVMSASVLITALVAGHAAAEDKRASAGDPHADPAVWAAMIPPNLRDRIPNEPKIAAAFAFVQDDPKLPRVLLIGDSISILYTPYVRDLLQGRANVHRVPANGRSTRAGLANLDAWLGRGRWDVIHFNWGLHDLVVNQKGDYAVPLEQYRQNLETLIARLQKTGARLIFATTTPVPEGERGRRAGDEQPYNVVAMEVVRRAGIPINDLCTAIAPHVAEYQAPHDVHFGPAGSEFLAKRVAGTIRNALDATGTPGGTSP